MDNSLYSFASPRRQYFSIAKDVIPYLIKNCNSPKVFQKLLQTCKYFSLKKKIIVVDTPAFVHSNAAYYYGRKTCIDILSFKENFQYWLMDNLSYSKTLLKFSFFKCLYRCNLIKLNIFKETLTFKEISFLLNGKKIERLYIYNSNIQNDDGTTFPIDAIMKQCPKLNHFDYENLCEIFSTETFEGLSKIKQNSKLHIFQIIISQIDGNKIIDTNIFDEFLKNFLDQTSKGTINFKCNFPDYGLFFSTFGDQFDNKWPHLKILNDIF